MALGRHPAQPGTLVDPGSAAAPTLRAVALVLVMGQAFGAYFVLRYLGLWSEQDTAVFARIVTAMLEAGSLTSPGAYTHGYAYPVWAANLSLFTGVSVPDLLQLYTPLLGNLFLGLFGFATYRRLLGSDRLAALATLTTYLVPELVFTISRGNHEKLTVSLTLMAILALVNSYREMRSPNRWRVFAAWVVTLYVTNFVLISLNIVLGSSFTVATTILLGFSLAVRLVRRRLPGRLTTVAGRLLLVAAINWLLVMLVTAYVYPTSSSNLRFLDIIQARLSELLNPIVGLAPVPTEPTFEVSDPYAVIGTDWTSPGVYQVISSFRWVLFFGSLVTAAATLVGFARSMRDTPVERLLLLGFYGAYGLLLALVVPIDYLSLSAGSNLQVRFYTYFALVAAPMFALGIGMALDRMRSRAARRASALGIGLLISAFALISLLKATLDPTISNRWLFHHPAEVQAMRFWNTRVWRLDDQPGPLWTDVEARLLYAYRTKYPTEPQGLNNFTFNRVPHSAYALASDPFRESVVRWRRIAPASWLQDVMYDNGAVQITHRTARTPFQR